MSVWDIGGQTKLRQLWKHYYDGAIAVVFVVDSHDENRLEEAKMELELMAEDSALKDWHLLVLANKQDLPNALTPMEVEEKLDIKNLRGAKSKHVQGCCALKKEGIMEGFQRLAETLKASK